MSSASAPAALTLPTLSQVQGWAREAGRLIREAFSHSDKGVSAKTSHADLVTRTDVQVEQFLVSTITTHFPGHKFICEEGHNAVINLGTEPTWIIDPVDGTMNFVHGIPLVAISIGFAVDGDLRLGIVYNPVADEMFCAEAGRGSTVLLNASSKSPVPRTLGVAPPRTLKEAVVALEFQSTRIKALADTPETQGRVVDEVLSDAKSLMLRARDIRRFGSCAIELAWLAAGRVDAVVQIGGYPWDYAAGVLLVREAGGFLRNFEQNSQMQLAGRNILAASTADLLEELHGVLRPRVPL